MARKDAFRTRLGVKMLLLLAQKGKKGEIEGSF
jgi:hypothetical protein